MLQCSTCMNDLHTLQNVGKMTKISKWSTGITTNTPKKYLKISEAPNIANSISKIAYFNIIVNFVK